jgi:hypothetical protein
LSNRPPIKCTKKLSGRSGKPLQNIRHRNHCRWICLRPGRRRTFVHAPVSDFAARYGDFVRDVSAWVGEGRIKYREDVVEGLENAPRALIGLLRGENFGKLLVRVAPASS